MTSVKQIWVIAAPSADPRLAGLARVRKENTRGKNARWILEDEAAQVPRTAYYLRRIRFGELLEISEDEAKALKVDASSPRRKPLAPVRDPFDTLGKQASED